MVEVNYVSWQFGVVPNENLIPIIVSNIGDFIVHITADSGVSFASFRFGRSKFIHVVRNPFS